GRRDDRLLERHVGIAFGRVEITVGVALIAEWSGGQPRHPAGMSGAERKLEAVRSGVGQPVHAVGPEVVILPLFAISDDRRSSRLEPDDGVANRSFVQRIESRIIALS